MIEFEFPFEELPLVVDLGFEAGLVNGTAAIRAADDGTWSVREIALDGYRQHTAAERSAGARGVYKTKPVVIDRESYSWLYLAIYDQLENGRFKTAVQDAVDKALDEAAADSGTRRRNHNAEHSTHA